MHHPAVVAATEHPQDAPLFLLHAQAQAAGGQDGRLGHFVEAVDPFDLRERESNVW